MHSPERRGAHPRAHTPGRMANWDLVRIFLEVARIGSFRAAAEQLNMSANFLSKRIPLLERAYKTTLLTGHVYGMPKNADDIRQNHRVVLQDAEQTKAKEMYEKYAAGREQIGFVAMRNNVSTAHLWSIAKGAGIGWLPTCVPALGDPLIPLDIGVQFQLDIWLTYHPDAKKIARVRQLIDWTVQSFDGRKYPWFSDEFVHPKDLQKAYKEAEPLVNLFAGFKKVSRPKIVPIYPNRANGTD